MAKQKLSHCIMRRGRGSSQPGGSTSFFSSRVLWMNRGCLGGAKSWALWPLAVSFNLLP